MIKQFSGTITSFLLNENIIEQEEKEIYQFGIERIVKNLFVIVVISLIALRFNIWIETIFMMASFIIIRKQAGGYHADTLMRCNAITFIVYVVNMILIQYMKLRISIIGFSIIGLCSVLIVFIIGPVDHKNLIFSDELLERLRRRSRVSVMIIVFTAIVASYVSGKIDRIYLSTMMGVFDLPPVLVPLGALVLIIFFLMFPHIPAESYCPENCVV